MKLAQPRRTSRTNWLQLALALGTLSSGLATQTLAQENKTASPSAAAAIDSSSEAKPANSSPAKKEPADSAGIGEILKMVDAGVSKQVLMAFIEHSSTPYALTSADVIALKDHGVSDDVTTALMNRGAQVKTQAQRARSNPVAPAIVRNLSTAGTLDPESYEFWLYHYAYPRSLAYSYRTLTPYTYPGYRYGIGPRFSLDSSRRFRP